MAFNLLTHEEQAKLVAILEKHLRYSEDFLPPENLPNDQERKLWRIGRAGYWPDVARRQPEYHRATWHYELGPALVIGDASTMSVPERPGEQLPVWGNAKHPRAAHRPSTFTLQEETCGRQSTRFRSCDSTLLDCTSRCRCTSAMSRR